MSSPYNVDSHWLEAAASCRAKSADIWLALMLTALDGTREDGASWICCTLPSTWLCDEFERALLKRQRNVSTRTPNALLQNSRFNIKLHYYRELTLDFRDSLTSIC